MYRFVESYQLCPTWAVSNTDCVLRCKHVTNSPFWTYCTLMYNDKFKTRTEKGTEVNKNDTQDVHNLLVKMAVLSRRSLDVKSLTMIW